jgi:hypothetical protein
VSPTVAPSEGNGVRGGTSDATGPTGETLAAIARGKAQADANDNAARRNLEA